MRLIRDGEEGVGGGRGMEVGEEKILYTYMRAILMFH